MSGERCGHVGGGGGCVREGCDSVGGGVWACQGRGVGRSGEGVGARGRHAVQVHCPSPIRCPKDWDIPLTISFTVYGWGHNHRGQLGGVEGSKVKVPRLSNSFADVSPVQLVGGEQTMFAVTEDGKVYASGYGASGRLGTGETRTITSPTPLPFFMTRGIAVKKVAVHSGGKHCLAVTTQGELYAWGEGEEGKLGTGSTR